MAVLDTVSGPRILDPTKFPRGEDICFLDQCAYRSDHTHSLGSVSGMSTQIELG